MGAQRPAEWIRLEISGVRTGRISMASLAAKGLWLELLTLAAASGDLTSVPADVRWIARQTGATVGEVEAAVAELCDIGSVVEDGDVLRIFGADRAMEQLLHSRESTRRRQAASRARKRETAASGSDSPADAGSRSTPLGEVRAAVREALEASDGSVSAVRAVLAEAVATAEAAAAAGVALSPKAASTLTNDVVGWTAKRWHDIEGKQCPRLFKAAQQVGADAVLWALCETATADVVGEPTSYVIAAAKRKAAEVRS